MSKFLSYPVRTIINPKNLFGANPAEYAPLGQKGHPGNDYEAPTGTPLYAPCAGMAVYATDSLGGDGIWIRFTDSDGQNYNVILWHMPTPADPAPPGVTSATQFPFQIPVNKTFVAVKKGQLLGYTDNSGYHPAPLQSETTGPHLHLGVQPANKNWIALNPNNGFLGCVDPTPFYDQAFAEDVNLIPAAIAAVQSAATIVQAVKNSPSATPAEKMVLFGEVKKVVQLIEEIL